MSWTATALSALSVGDTVVTEQVRLETIDTIPSKFAHDYARMEYIGELFMAFVDNVQPSFIAIEDYALGASQGAHKKGELGGYLRHLLWQGGYSFFLVPPTVLKKFVLGKGQGAKELMMMNAFKRWGYEAPDNDACDAYCLSRLLWQLATKPDLKLTQDLRKSCRLIESQLELRSA